MNFIKIYHHHLHPSPFHISQTTLPPPPPSPIHFLPLHPHKPNLSLSSKSIPASTFPSYPPFSLSKPQFKFNHVKVLAFEAQYWSNEEEENSDLTTDGEVYKKTLRLVECSMFAALGGLAYILSSSLAIENYFGCFFALPIVFSSMRWDLVAGRKTMVATTTLLLVLSGPVKALTYLLQYGLLGLTMGSLWRVRATWGLSIFLCACVVRALGSTGYVLMYSFLIRENILALITRNIHASLAYIFTSIGLYSIPSMDAIYAIFWTLVLLNCSFFVFLLHLLYAVFFTRLGMKSSLRLPGWLEKAI